MAEDKTANAAPAPDPDADLTTPQFAGQPNPAATTPAAPQTKAERKAENASASTKRDEGALVDEFLKRSGYKREDVLGSSAERRTVVTSNGGKYVVARDGGIMVLSGPATPKGHAFVEQAPETGNLATFEG